MVNLFSPEGISALVQTHGYILLLVLMLIEGPITTYTAAFAASLGLFNIYLVFILSILGNVIPDTILFFIGRLTRTSFVESILETFGMNRSRIKKMEIGLKKHIGKSITLFKLTPGLAIPGLIIAGFTKVSFKRFFIVMLLFNMSSAIMFTLLGFYSGIAASTIFKYFKIGDYILLAMIPLIIFIYWIYKKFLRDYPQENLGKIDKISVIIPAYNEEKNLQTIIRHLRDQSSRNFEIIVVDNNSTDGTFNIAKKLADKACKCKTQGISYARN
ncbi:MAG: glycosyltransferase, partial [Candidatus Woesearchaeota archaeon]|nr:glycosyltransferase [Candidatus Woesearchaeota archaeon]